MAKVNENGLTDNQQKFADYYLSNGCNAKQAYIEVYGTKKENVAESSASRLLRNVKVSAYIEDRQKKIQEETQVTQEYVIKNLKEMVERCMKHKPVLVFNPVEKCMEQKTEELFDSEGNHAGYAGVYTFDSIGANKALEMLGKTLGLFKDKSENVLPTIININYDYGDGNAGDNK